MFKAIPYIVKLHLCKNVDCRVNRVAHFYQNNALPQKTTYSQVQERDPCKQPDPCPPPPPDDRAFWGALAILFTMGCFGVYAKHKPEVRDWLTIHAPWYDDLIAIAYEENKTHAESARDLVRAIQEYVTRPDPPRLCTTDGKPIKQPPKEKNKTALEVVCPKKEGEEQVDPKKSPKGSQIPSNLKTICDIEKCMLSTGEDCINNYWTARQACRYYNDLVEENLTNFSYERLKALRPAMQERLELLNEHACAAARALKVVEELGRILECGITAPKDAIDNSRALFREFLAKIKVIQTEYIWENDKSVSLDARWQQVEKAIDQMVFENEILLPGTKYEVEPGKLKSLTGDPDLLLHHTLKYQKMLEEVLKERSQAASERAQRGLETLPPTKDPKARDAHIQAEFRKKQAQLDQYYKKQLDFQKNENDKALKEALRKQAERHEHNMVVQVKEREIQATARLNKMVKEAVEAQKRQFARDLAEMSNKVKEVEERLEDRLKAERETKRSQLLYSAGVSLLAKTKKGDPTINVAKEIRAIEQAAGDGDKLVLTVLKAIPEQARKVGVVPESVLRERYHLMEKTAMAVALVEQEGSPMPVYIASWIQSLLLFMRLSGIPQKDIDKPFKEKKELEDLDTFDRLNYARYWVEQGSLAAALPYVDSLEGASRVAADEWYKDAKTHLEIRQAAEAVLAHAAAMGLQYI